MRRRMQTVPVPRGEYRSLKGDHYRALLRLLGRQTPWPRSWRRIAFAFPLAGCGAAPPEQVGEVQQAVLTDGEPGASGAWTYLGNQHATAEAYFNCWQPPAALSSSSYTFTGIQLDYVKDARNFAYRCSFDTSQPCTVNPNNCPQTATCTPQPCTPPTNFCTLTRVSGSVHYEHIELGCAVDNGALGYASAVPRYHAAAWTGASALAPQNYPFGPPGKASVTMADGAGIKEPGDGLEGYNIAANNDPDVVGFRINQASNLNWYLYYDRGQGAGWEAMGYYSGSSFSYLTRAFTQSSSDLNRGSITWGAQASKPKNDLGSGVLGEAANPCCVAGVYGARYRDAIAGAVTSYRTTAYEVVSGSNRVEGTQHMFSPDNGYSTDFFPGYDPFFFGGPGQP
jgi:hypothetical protein